MSIRSAMSRVPRRLREGMSVLEDLAGGFEVVM